MHYANYIEGIDYGKRVQVYWNIHKKVYSVRQGGKVVAHVRSPLLRDVRFGVGQAGRAKVLATKSKNVHAFVTGYLVPENSTEWYEIFLQAYAGEAVTYNPFKHSTFVLRRTSAPIHDAAHTILDTVATKPVIIAL